MRTCSYLTEAQSSHEFHPNSDYVLLDPWGLPRDWLDPDTATQGSLQKGKATRYLLGPNWPGWGAGAILHISTPRLGPGPHILHPQG